MTDAAASAPPAVGSQQPAQRPVFVGVDGSAGSVAALRWAAEEARAHGRPLSVVTAYDAPAYYGYPMVPVPELDEAQQQAAEACLDAALKEVYGDENPPGVQRVVRQGNPAQVLIDAAEDASVLVVGARGHGRFLLGSVSDRCVHHASCPVVVVRN